MERVKALSCWPVGDLIIKATGDVREELQLGEGRTNQNFIVDDSDGCRSFVRIGADLPYFGVARAREQAATRASAAAGIAPRVKHTELPDALVIDFVDGRALTEADVHEAAGAGGDNALLSTLTKAIKQLHAQAIPAELTKFLEEVGEVGYGGPHLAKWLAYAESCKYSRWPLLDGVRDLVQKIEVAAEPLCKVPAAFCHFDLLADNFVLCKGSDEIMLVDFEYAAPGQPLMDLAVLAMGCSLTSTEERNLLTSYLGAEVTDEQHNAFKALKLLAALRETLWGTTAELSESSALSKEEACAYVDMNYNKFVELRAEFEGTSNGASKGSCCIS